MENNDDSNPSERAKEVEAIMREMRVLCIESLNDRLTDDDNNINMHMLVTCLGALSEVIPRTCCMLVHSLIINSRQGKTQLAEEAYGEFIDHVTKNVNEVLDEARRGYPEDDQ